MGEVVRIDRLPAEIEMPEHAAMVGQGENGPILWFFNEQHQVMREVHHAKRKSTREYDVYDYDWEMWYIPHTDFDGAGSFDTYEELRDAYNRI